MKIVKTKYQFSNKKHTHWTFYLKNKPVAYICSSFDWKGKLYYEIMDPIMDSPKKTFSTAHEAKKFLRNRLISTAKSLEKAANQIK